MPPVGGGSEVRMFASLLGAAYDVHGGVERLQGGLRVTSHGREGDPE